ncbi:hypothetical protein BT96DRAFT_988893 [Gymnopus androsaceus JB14]|uniref:Uncharacterized protein n=1 Tax=Gymnopus androsaceus JB14 TaxID=1447944 RepID=A0A6A4I8N1_9AGAR|nr:hypothetical protein BT96DRAFT_988893 [Gymnopus androsaceus JB14]
MTTIKEVKIIFRPEEECARDAEAMDLDLEDGVKDPPDEEARCTLLSLLAQLVAHLSLGSKKFEPEVSPTASNLYG